MSLKTIVGTWLVMGFVVASSGCGEKEGPPPTVNKREVQNRADQTHDSLKDEEDRSKKRKND